MSFELPHGTYGRICERSGLANEYELVKLGGIIQLINIITLWILFNILYNCMSILFKYVSLKTLIDGAKTYPNVNGNSDWYWLKDFSFSHLKDHASEPT